MLRFDPDKRFSAEESLAHPFFKSLKEQEYMQQKYYSSSPTPTATSSTSGEATAPSSISPVPMNPDLEKMGESRRNLKENVIFYYINTILYHILFNSSLIYLFKIRLLKRL
jgi:serine/threonine protein kinase